MQKEYDNLETSGHGVWLIFLQTKRLVIALAVEHVMHLHQMDVSAAYLNGELQDDAYMRQPEGFVDANHPKRILKLHKSLYGLKQSGLSFFDILVMEIERDGKTGNVSIGYKQYFEGLLHEYGMQDCKPNATLEVGFQTKSDRNDCGQVDKTCY
ncbi:uncharacterized protein LOC124461399 [Drosophila willistoni]|uniref:uncharacterized protein LOC124461399 n=1 Tax=Drosophila willistoni TaxID=7260 RepID=UPI001F074BA7|nr:uncharacterized protein LOC124461399 [Drosophila willistoni]